MCTALSYFAEIQASFDLDQQLCYVFPKPSDFVPSPGKLLCSLSSECICYDTYLYSWIAELQFHIQMTGTSTITVITGFLVQGNFKKFNGVPQCSSCAEVKKNPLRQDEVQQFFFTVYSRIDSHHAMVSRLECELIAWTRMPVIR